MNSRSYLAVCLVAFACFFTASAIVVGDGCYDVSFANRVAENFDALTIPAHGADRATVQAFAKQMIDVFALERSTYKSMAYFATPDSDFFGVSHCYSSVSITDSWCNAVDGKYLFVVRHPAMGSTQLLGFKVNGDNAVDLSSEPVGSDAYDPVARPWWPIENNWSDPYTDFLSAVSLSTLVVNSANGNYKIGVDRDSGEPCNFCYTNKDAIPLVEATAQGTFEHPEDFTQESDFQPIIKRLLDLVQQSATKFTYGLYIGFANNDFYGLWNCRVVPSYNKGACVNTTAPFYANIANARLFGDQHRRWFEVDDEGNIGALIGVSPNNYFPTQRPWYLTSRGWTRPYSFADAPEVTSRSFTSKFDGGVVSSDMDFEQPCSLQTEEACQPYCRPCIDPPPCPSSAPCPPRPSCPPQRPHDDKGAENEFNFIFSGMIPSQKH